MTRVILAICAMGIAQIVEGRESTALVEDSLTTFEDFIVVEDFSDSQLDSLPRRWGWRDKDDAKQKSYLVKETNGYKYLAAEDFGSSVVLLKQAQWDPRDYPIMTWCWRARALPPQGDERYTPTNDSAAGLYVIFSRNFLGIPRQIKYLWSTTLPIGTVDRREGIARPWFVVKESGEEEIGVWLQEMVDLQKDSERILDRDLPKYMLGIGILTDANSTHSHAAADYADFRVWPRAALTRRQIPNYCECLKEATDASFSSP